jgi:hypothetical protein
MNHLSSTAKTTTGSGNEGLAKASQNAEVTPPTTRSPSKEKAKHETKPSWAAVLSRKGTAEKAQLSWAEEANEEVAKNPEQQRRSMEAHVAPWVTTQERQTAEASEAYEQEAQNTQVAEAVAGAALGQEMPEPCINETSGTHEHAPPRCYANKATQVSTEELHNRIDEINEAIYREGKRTQITESEAEAPEEQVRQPLVNEVNEAPTNEAQQIEAQEEDKASEWKTVLNKSTWGPKQGSRKATDNKVTNEAEAETPQGARPVGEESLAPEEENAKETPGKESKRKGKPRQRKKKNKTVLPTKDPVADSPIIGDLEMKEATEENQVEEKQQAQGWTIVPPTLRYWIERARQWVATSEESKG